MLVRPLASRLVGRFLIAWQRIIRPLPRREEIEFAEFLIEADGFVDHPLLLVVVAHLDKAGEREILAVNSRRMSGWPVKITP